MGRPGPGAGGRNLGERARRVKEGSGEALVPVAVNPLRLPRCDSPSGRRTDSAAWCAPVPLSVTSLAKGGKPVEVPDFTRGEWKKLRLGLDSARSAMPAVV